MPPRHAALRHLRAALEIPEQPAHHLLPQLPTNHKHAGPEHPPERYVRPAWQQPNSDAFLVRRGMDFAVEQPVAEA